MLQDVGIALELRQRFEDHMVLVELGVHRVDLALSQGVVKSVVDGRRSDTEARRGDAIDDQRDRQSAGLLVGGDILQLR